MDDGVARAINSPSVSIGKGGAGITPGSSANVTYTTSASLAGNPLPCPT